MCYLLQFFLPGVKYNTSVMRPPDGLHTEICKLHTVDGATHARTHAAVCLPQILPPPGCEARENPRGSMNPQAGQEPGGKGPAPVTRGPGTVT